MKKEYELKLKDFIILLFDKNDIYPPLNVDDLREWFRHHKLSEVEVFPNWIYLIDGNVSYFELLRDGVNWNVKKTDKPDITDMSDENYFTFTCENAKSFIKDFERELFVRLKKDENGPPTFNGWVGEVQVT